MASYTISLIQDLKQDTTILSEIISFCSQDSARLHSIKNRMSSTSANLDTLKFITRNDLLFDYKAYRPPNTNTLLAMQSDGIIELYDKNIYNKLVELQTTQNIIGSIIRGNISDHNMQFIALNSKYALSKYAIIKGPLLEEAWSNVNGDDLFRRVES